MPFILVVLVLTGTMCIIVGGIKDIPKLQYPWESIWAIFGFTQILFVVVISFLHLTTTNGTQLNAITVMFVIGLILFITGMAKYWKPDGPSSDPFYKSPFAMTGLVLICGPVIYQLAF